MNLLNIRKVGYGVRSIDELRARRAAALNRSRPSSPGVDRNRSFSTMNVLTPPATAATAGHPASADNRFAAAAAIGAESGINEQKRGTRHPPGAGAPRPVMHIEIRR